MRENMTQVVRILAGIQSDFGRGFIGNLSKEGHTVQFAKDISDIFMAIGLYNQDDPKQPVFNHDYLIMDAHLGSDSNTFRPAEIIYKRIYESIIDGKIGFIALAKDPQILSGARAAEIPVLGMRELTLQCEFYSLIRGETKSNSF